MRFLSAFGVIASLAILAGSANAQKVPPQLLGSKAIEAITGSTISFYAPESTVVTRTPSTPTGGW
jgi:hypothetical protein